MITDDGRFDIFRGEATVNVFSGGTQISDQLLDGMVEKCKIFSTCDVFDNYGENYDGSEEEDPGIMFYDNMIDHPRFDEFMEIEINSIFDKIRDNHTNPRVYAKFTELLTKKLADEFGLSKDMFEEFLHFARNKKSSRSI
jgi:hypothetical protein